MATRKIKDAKDLSTNELIYFKGHAQATYMSDGTTVEDAINNISISGGDGSSSSTYTWTWYGEDSGTLADGEFEKIRDAEFLYIYMPQVGITALSTVKVKSEEMLLYVVHGIEVNEPVLSNMGFMFAPSGVFELERISYDVVTPDTLSTVATSGDYNDLSNKPTIPTESTVSGWGFTKNAGTYSKPSGGIPNSDLSSDVRDALRYAEMYQGTVTSVKINGETKGSNGGVVDLGNVGTYSKPSTGIPKSDLASDVQASLSNADNAVQAYSFADLETIIQVQAFEGSLSGNLYALPDEVTGDEDDVIATRNTLKTINGESIVGSGNIEISGGTITGVSANGTSIATSGVANIPAASTSKYGVTKLTTLTNSSSTTLAATASAVKAAYDLANSYKGTVTGVKINGATKNPSSGVVDLGTVITDISGKQDKLVSGTNIKTINGTSILGSGDITISGGETVTEVKVNGVSKSPSNGVIDLGYINKPVSEFWESSVVLSPNVYYRAPSLVRELTITLENASNNNILNEYFVEFTTDIDGAVISFPWTVHWVNGKEPTFDPDFTYQVSIVNNLGTWIKFNG